MEQLQLLLRDKHKEVSVEVIMACGAFKDALKLCKSISGLEDKQLAGHLDIDPGQWARIFGNAAHFSENKLLKFMDICGNKIPLIWLAMKCGYTLSPLKTELELELEARTAEADEYRKKYEYAIEALRAVKG